MKGLILSGGKGTRLRPLTHTAAKQLLPVANKPILFYGLEALKEAGISEIAIVVGETAEEIKAAVGNGAAWGLNVTYIQQDEPRGLAHAVKIAQSFVGAEPFVVYLGDNLIKGGIAPFVRQFEEEKPDAQILLKKVADPRRFGIAQVMDSKIVKLVEKPQEPIGDLAIVGVYLLTPKIFPAIEQIKPSWRNELEITDALQKMVETGANVKPFIFKSWWKDTGKVQDLLEANQVMVEDIELFNLGLLDEHSRISGKVSIGKGSQVRNSIVRGPAIIGDNCRLNNAYIGPYTSLYHGVTIEACEIENSVVLNDTTLSRIPGRIQDSLIGSSVIIQVDDTRPIAHKFMLGDHCVVKIPAN